MNKADRLAREALVEAIMYCFIPNYDWIVLGRVKMYAELRVKESRNEFLISQNGDYSQLVGKWKYWNCTSRCTETFITRFRVNRPRSNADLAWFGLAETDVCSKYQQEREDLEHVFFRCSQRTEEIEGIQNVLSKYGIPREVGLVLNLGGIATRELLPAIERFV